MEGTSRNRLNKNSEKEFKLVENVIDMINSDSKQYKRDFLLKLRVHPLSLQKPTQLPKVEVVKDKLNLHNINDSSCEYDEKFADSSNVYPTSKAEYSNVKHDYPLISPYFNRMYPYCYPTHMCSGSYINAAPKFRMAPQVYCNSLKKNSAATHGCYKDYNTEECFIPKRCYPLPEDIWSCYPATETINFSKKKIEVEAVPKSRKKLSIIDPVTGKNILENITETESIAHSENENLNPDTYVESSEEPYEDYYDDENIKQDVQASGDLIDSVSPLPSGDTVSTDNTTSSTCDETIQSEKIDNDGLTMHENLTHGTQSSAAGVRSHQYISEDVIKTSLDKTSDKISDSPKTLEDNNAPALVCEQLSKSHSSLETSSASDNPATSSSFAKYDKCSQECMGNAPKQDDCIKERLKLLKDKIFSLRQEQQKMAIMQSFLRYKKYQLEESARNLDEKKIDMANFEWNLYNKAKILQEREQWLQQKSEMLYEKAVKLAHKEKILNGQEDLNSSDGSKNSSLRKFLEDDRNMSCGCRSSKNKSSKCKETNDNEFSYVKRPSNLSNISSVLNAPECRSVISSLDLLEKNIVNIEKIHDSKEIGNSFPDEKSESFQSHSTPNKDENVSSEPLGLSKGRRYLPEHIKYWLNKRDKNAS